MPDKIQKKRNQIMQKRLKNYHVKKWADDFKENLLKVKSMQAEFF